MIRESTRDTTVVVVVICSIVVARVDTVITEGAATQLGRESTIGGMSGCSAADDGVGRNRVLIGVTTCRVVVKSTGTTVVDWVTFTTHSEHFFGRQ